MTKKRVPKRKISKPTNFVGIRLVQIPNACDLDGEPRVALDVPQPGSLSRRHLMMFPTIAAALATKSAMEAGR